MTGGGITCRHNEDSFCSNSIMMVVFLLSLGKERAVAWTVAECRDLTQDLELLCDADLS